MKVNIVAERKKSEIKKDECREEEVFEKELNTEAFNVVKRLYEKTFKDLVDR